MPNWISTITPPRSRLTLYLVLHIILYTSGSGPSGIIIAMKYIYQRYGDDIKDRYLEERDITKLFRGLFTFEANSSNSVSWPWLSPKQ